MDLKIILALDVFSESLKFKILVIDSNCITTEQLESMYNQGLSPILAQRVFSTSIRA